MIESFIAVVVGCLFVVVIILSIARKIKDNKLLETVTNKHRGTKTERKLVLKILEANFDARAVFHDLYIKKSNGDYSQIDVVVPTKVGIFVFEVKEYSGWLFGNGNNRYWTQVLAYGKEKHRFYNPIWQNKGHIQALKSRFGNIGDVPFYSIIVFYGNCTIKKLINVPKTHEVCYNNQVNGIIKQRMNNNPANYLNKQHILDILREGVKNGANPEICKEHIYKIKRFC